jgi:hypothetical protein
MAALASDATGRDEGYTSSRVGEEPGEQTCFGRDAHENGPIAPRRLRDCKAHSCSLRDKRVWAAASPEAAATSPLRLNARTDKALWTVTEGRAFRGNLAIGRIYEVIGSRPLI